jgi:hypothetical protein
LGGRLGLAVALTLAPAVGAEARAERAAAKRARAASGTTPAAPAPAKAATGAEAAPSPAVTGTPPPAAAPGRTPPPGESAPSSAAKPSPAAARAPNAPATDYPWTGASLGVGLEALSYVRSIVINRNDGAVFEVTSRDLVAPTAFANVSGYGRFGVYAPTKAGWRPLLAATGGVSWYGRVVGSDTLTNRLQLGIGLVRARSQGIVLDALYGLEYAYTPEWGVALDLHSLVGLTPGAGVSVMVRRHL